jgi:hypothetical protein
LKHFLTQPFSLGPILYHFVSLINKILCSVWILQLPMPLIMFCYVTQFCPVYWVSLYCRWLYLVSTCWLRIWSVYIRCVSFCWFSIFWIALMTLSAFCWVLLLPFWRLSFSREFYLVIPGDHLSDDYPFWVRLHCCVSLCRLFLCWLVSPINVLYVITICWRLFSCLWLCRVSWGLVVYGVHMLDVTQSLDIMSVIIFDFVMPNVMAPKKCYATLTLPNYLFRTSKIN